MSWTFFVSNAYYFTKSNIISINICRISTIIAIYLWRTYQWNRKLKNTTLKECFPASHYRKMAASNSWKCLPNFLLGNYMRRVGACGRQLSNDEAHFLTLQNSGFTFLLFCLWTVCSGIHNMKAVDSFPICARQFNMQWWTPSVTMLLPKLMHLSPPKKMDTS